jgi:hypothetical protein
VVQPLESFTAIADKHGGEVRLAWTYPSTLPSTWKLYIFKKAGEAVTDQNISDYFAGTLSDDQLAELGIFVFRDLANTFEWIGDFQVENGRQYFYRALIRDLTELENSSTQDANATASADILLNVVDGKGLVVRAVKKAIDALKTAQGTKPVIPKNVAVFRSFSRRKEEDFWVVVARGAGQTVERYFSNLIAEYGDAVVRGEVDLDVLDVQWFSIGDPARRDHFTDLMRVMRVLMYRYLLNMGNGDVRDARFVMNGDSEGPYQGEQAISGSMTVVLVVEQQLQFGREIAPLGKISTVYLDP